MFNQRLIEELRQGLIILDKGNNKWDESPLVTSIIKETFGTDVKGLMRYYTCRHIYNKIHHDSFEHLNLTPTVYEGRKVVHISAFLEPELEIDEC